MTDLNKWTQKAQEALQNARQLAIRFSQQQLDCEHLLAALLEMQDGLAVSLLTRLGVAIPQLRARTEEELSRKPRVAGDTEEGKIYEGTVTGIKEFGAFVEILPGQDGLCHISELADTRIRAVEDVCKVGDKIWVKVIAVDDRGRVKLSRREAMRDRDKAAAAPTA